MAASIPPFFWRDVIWRYPARQSLSMVFTSTHFECLTAEGALQMAIRILVVDDERIIADTLATILRSSGYDCRTAYDGTQALDLVDVFEPNLVISDVAMPNLTGVELYHQLKAKPNAPAVMLLSGNVHVLELLRKEKQSGHRLEVIAKPIPPPQLLATVAQLVKGLSA